MTENISRAHSKATQESAKCPVCSPKLPSHSKKVELTKSVVNPLLTANNNKSGKNEYAMTPSENHKFI
ncbi:hypothetical protein [Zooshikella sp. RANM57]|uniref:hypothetical protein n=1 Tax=Zooshikella sp. RANM57 TaxID=3425863 RepID=UPI003D6F7202